MKADLKYFFVREGKVLAASLIVGLVFALGITAYSYVYAHSTQRDIAENVIRFHVRANSNTEQDQALKDYVRTAVLARFEDYLHVSNDLETTRAILTKNLDNMRQYAEEVIHKAGFDYTVSADMALVFFPTMLYGNIAFPPGKYEAVQLVIGDGVGDNWWCLMFPPLCYVDMTSTDAGRAKLAENVSNDSFMLLTHQDTGDTGLRVRFRVVEWWQNRGQPAQPQGNFVSR